jgi:hypothetical protein
MNKEELLTALQEWRSSHFQGMLDHLKSTIEGGCSFERWIVLSFGKFLCDSKKFEPYQIKYEKKYKVKPGKCDLWVDSTWIEFKHIWTDTQPKVEKELDRDIDRIKIVKNGFFVIIEIGVPDWYKDWKMRNPELPIFINSMPHVSP